jgi:uncharacterized protein (TIGR02271 family)
MTHTVVGLFDSKDEARKAMNELVQKGFVKENIDFSQGRASDSTSSTTAATDTTAGDSISSFFGSLFSDNETEARTYTNAARQAEGILTVQVDSDERARQVAEIFDNNGAIDIDGQSSQQQNFAQNRQTTQNKTANQGDMAIPVIEEDLQVGKRAVEQGGVRVRSRIIEKPVEENVRLREEHVYVNRRPVDRAVTDSDLSNFKEGDIELTERSEEAVVSKQARVVEEVSVGKNVEERDQVVRDTVRRTDVDVEEINTDRTDSTDTRRANN